MYISVLCLLVLLNGFVKCDTCNFTISLNNTVICDSTKLEIKYGDALIPRICSPNKIYEVRSNPLFDWYTEHQGNYYCSQAKVDNVFYPIAESIWRIDILRNEDADMENMVRILQHNYSLTTCEVIVKVLEEQRYSASRDDVKEIPYSQFYLLIGLLTAAAAIIAVESVFLAVYLQKGRKLKKIHMLKPTERTDEVDTARYSKTPSQKKYLSQENRDSNVYECLESIKLSGQGSSESDIPPLPPYPTPQARVKLLEPSSNNSTLEKPVPPLNKRPPVVSPKMRPKIPPPTQLRRPDSPDEELYEPPPDYRKSYTLPPRGIEFEKRALIDAIMAKKQPTPSMSRQGLDQANVEKNVLNRPRLPSPSRLQQSGGLQQWTSTQNLISTPKVAPKKLPLAVTKKPPIPIESELATALKRRRNVPAEPARPEPPVPIPAPVTMKQRQDKIPVPNVPHKPPMTPKHIHVQDIPSNRYSADENMDDDEWTYEPLAPYNIYNI